MRPSLFVIPLGIVLMLGLAHTKAAPVTEKHQARITIASPHVFTRGDTVYVRLDRATQKTIGLKTETLRKVDYRRRIRAYGQVVDLSRLLQDDRRLSDASARKIKAQARLDATRNEYRRLTNLYRLHRNTSKKALQAAQANWLTARATAAAARVRLLTQQAALHQRWGQVISRWMTEENTQWQALISGRHRLVKLTRPLGNPPIELPLAAEILLADDTMVPITWVSPAPTIAPGLQGQADYFLATSRLDSLSYGLQITGLIRYGAKHSGVIVPSTAVVWSQGNAYLYVEDNHERFERRQLHTDQPVPGGWFEANGLIPGMIVVTKGAQILLSEQTLASAPKGDAAEEGDHD